MRVVGYLGSGSDKLEDGITPLRPPGSQSDKKTDDLKPALSSVKGAQSNLNCQNDL